MDWNLARQRSVHGKVLDEKLMVWVAVVALMFGSVARAQDLAGDWQGTLHAAQDLRIILRISKGEKDGLSAKMYSIDQGAYPIAATSIRRQGSNITIVVDAIGGNYEGKLSADGNVMSGTWTQGSKPLSLDLVRATKETAWEIPTAPAAAKPMAADADPSFDVATIKPNASGEASMQQLTIMGRNFVMKNGSLGDMVAFAYNVQMKQIVNGPQWMDKDRYDIAAVPDVEGSPTIEQLRIMMRKLLTDRFKLTFHHDKRELPAFVLSVGKTAPKLTPSESKGTLPNIGMRPGSNGMKMMLGNATIADFTGFLQMLVLDRPVVDRTGIAGRYDLGVTFTADDSQFNGRPPPMPPLAQGTEAAPPLFDAIQMQLGLRLAPEKTAVDVIAIDHVEKPSAN